MSAGLVAKSTRVTVGGWAVGDSGEREGSVREKVAVQSPVRDLADLDGAQASDTRVYRFLAGTDDASK
jgi:hypothetical protein